MNDIYLVNYSVKGIKTLDELVSLSFYKKTITKNPDTQNYNIKGIYGMNGSGKSAIISSVDILRNILTESNYLNNPLVQENLDAIINKKLKELYIEVDYMVNADDEPVLFKYKVILSKDDTQKYIISHEQLSFKPATSKSEVMKRIFEISDGKINYINKEDGNEEFYNDVVGRTMNLLTTASLGVIFLNKFVLSLPGKTESVNIINNIFGKCTKILFFFGSNLHVFLDKSDDHMEYVALNSLKSNRSKENSVVQLKTLINYLNNVDAASLNVVSVMGNIVPKKLYDDYKETISKLYEFLHIFKSDLKGIEIDKKDNKGSFVCNLVMVYDGYKISAEYESTGIKKLIRLFAYINEMVHGGIVFIDEFDSNLHDVYLCALLEYLMEYGKGQLCFTTHNVGPMDVLKQHKKSIDFLSENHKIYPWIKSGNYSPSKLYRNGMIEGSPFNVDAIDFINIFGAGEEDE